jgi:hypothetical protein
MRQSNNAQRRRVRFREGKYLGEKVHLHAEHAEFALHYKGPAN